MLFECIAHQHVFLKGAYMIHIKWLNTENLLGLFASFHLGGIKIYITD